jgi:hypothetical protein
MISFYIYTFVLKPGFMLSFYIYTAAQITLPFQASATLKLNPVNAVPNQYVSSRPNREVLQAPEQSVDMVLVRIV